MEYQAKAQQALGLAGAGRAREAAPLLRELLRDFDYVVDFEYDDWLRALADSARALGDHTTAGYIYLYLHYFDMALQAFEAANSRQDLALCEEVRGNHLIAASLYKEEGLFVRAAINLERAKVWDQAIAAWESARSSLHPQQAPYPFALATVNLALALRQRGQTGRTRDLFVEAIMLLEGLADEWENQGFVDEALGAYHVLCLIGQVERRFENLAEGYCNAIRLLKGQGQTYRAFRYYAALTEYGEDLGEDHAVATLHREAADYAVRTGTLYQNFYLRQAAQAYLRVGERTHAQSSFPELAENAFLAAIDAFNQMGDLQQVLECYHRLTQLPLEAEKVERYARIAKETAAMERAPAAIYEPSRLLRTPYELPEVWRDDLVQHESGDDSMSVLTGIVWNLEFGDVARRKALNLILYQLDLRHRGERDAPGVDRDIAAAMSGLRYNIAYKTLRQLVQSPHPEVRAEVMRSAGRMGHPKAFLLFEPGLADGHPEVRRAALEGLQVHTYPEAYDHLVKVYQQHGQAEVREAAVRTLGQLRSFEGAEFLWGVLRVEASDAQEQKLQEAAAGAFRAGLRPEWRAIFRSKLHVEPSGPRERLQALLG